MKILFNNTKKIERIVEVPLVCMSCESYEPFYKYKWPACDKCPNSTEIIYHEGDIGNVLLTFIGIDWKWALSLVENECKKYIENRYPREISYFEWMDLNFIDLKLRLGKYWDIFLATHDWYPFYSFSMPADYAITFDYHDSRLKELERMIDKNYNEYNIIQRYVYECISDESFYSLEKYQFAVQWFLPVYVNASAIQPLTILETDYKAPEFKIRMTDDEEKSFRENFINNLNKEFEECRINENPLYHCFDEKYYYNQHDAQSLSSLLVILLKKVLESGFKFKICHNCNTPFIPYKRQDRIYCDKLSPQDITKTCQEFGARQAYQDSLSTNEAMKLYRNIYMAKQMMVKRNPDIIKYTDDFEDFKKTSKKWKNNIKNGTMKKEDYLCWLKAIKNKSY